MERNNGKIAIAIVAMFVVALSIIGFTYAYFTASVINNDQAESVSVTAGILQIDYTTGNKITAYNIVPGWTNDGLHYYDPVASLDTETGHITAAVGTLDEDNNLVKATNGSIDNPSYVDGIATPATISITNTASNATKDGADASTAYYAIRLTSIENGLAGDLNADNEQNFTGTLYRTTAAGATTGGTEVWTGGINASGTQVIMDKADVVDGIAKNDTTHNYYLVLNYADDGEETTQNASMGATVKATIEVVGIAERADGAWVDGDNNVIFPAA